MMQRLSRLRWPNLLLVEAIAFALILTSPTSAQETEPPPSQPPEEEPETNAPEDQDGPRPPRHRGPHDRKRFNQNLERWEKLPPEAKAALREREGHFKKRLQREIDEAITSTGLTLDEEQKKDLQAAIP